VAARTEELRRDIEQTRQHMSGTLDAIGDRVSPGRIVERRWDRARHKARHLNERVMGTPRHGVGSARDHLGDLAHSASDVAHAAGDAVTSAPDKIESTTQGAPLVVGAVTFGLGVLIGSMTPPSREETQLAEQVMEPVRNEAQAIAQEVVGSAKDQATSGVDQTRQAVSEATGEVTSHARDAAREVSQRAGEAKNDVADQMQGAAGDRQAGDP
jgi:hypothetical protein